MKILFACTVLILNLNFLSAQNNKTSWLEDNWKGFANQPLALTQQDWPIKLEFQKESNNYTISYPSFPCGGSWKLVKGTKKKAEFVETISYGTDKCVNNMYVVIKRVSKNKLKITYLFQDSKKVDAEGFLERNTAN